MNFFLTIIYASNALAERYKLWEWLVDCSKRVNDAWYVMGDFNNVMYSMERLGRGIPHPRETAPFVVVIQVAGLTEMNTIGLFYTWDNKAQGHARIVSKINRCFINASWLHSQVTEAVAANHTISDHCPIVVKWKLNLLKNRLKPWAKTRFSQMHHKVSEAKEGLYRIQRDLQGQPMNNSLILEEQEALKTYSRLAQAEQADLQQRSSMDWLTLVDRCTAFYHNSKETQEQYL
ncbi:hypothetical protein FRX31_005531 [Thalictrum thalictroides]|uniref:Dnase i-like superfamily protein n=1 Tax=Thalictrum thalictroides TaxID=46969 RepID=A0A7J6X7K4_THATH|nr:hypothetical protein FRX31_005531 [Thalictrum thalictroides]